MKFENYMTLEFPSKSSNEAFARSAVACFAAQMDPTLEELGDIRTAVSEAVTNCIVHAYSNSIGKVYITCTVFAESEVISQLAQDTDKCDIIPFSLCLNNCITIKGCKLFRTDKNSWISGPSYKGKDGDYKEYLYIDKELNVEMEKLVSGLEAILDA